MIIATTNTTEPAPSPSETAPAKQTKPKTSKRDQLLKLLDRPRGATMKQIEAQLAWQPHTIRAAISRIRTGGVNIELDKAGATARYRIVSGDAS